MYLRGMPVGRMRAHMGILRDMNQHLTRVSSSILITLFILLISLPHPPFRLHTLCPVQVFVSAVDAFQCQSKSLKRWENLKLFIVECDVPM